MGHAEMLLAVAGLNELQSAERAQQLASGDWSSFPPDLRVVMHHARKLSKEPQTLVASDVQALVRQLGPDRSLDWIYHICWANFMTRFADAFQLPLESTNVFLPPDRWKQPPDDAAAETNTGAAAATGTPTDAPQAPVAPIGAAPPRPPETRRLLWRRAHGERGLAPRLMRRS